MTRTAQIKQYKAVESNVCVKQFAETLEPGWFETAAEALQNFKPVAIIPPTVEIPAEPVQAEEPTKRRGRPRKE